MQGSRENKTTPAEPQSKHATELGIATELVFSVCEPGQVFDLESLGDPVFTVVLEGSVTDVAKNASLGQGEVLQAGLQYIAQTSVQLWQVTGPQAVTGDLRRFAERLCSKDPLTAAHSVRVGWLAWLLGRALNLGPARLALLTLAAYLHDLGKLSLPSGLLQSRAHLSVSQWQLMMGHPVAGRQMLEPTPLAPLGPILEQHHERLDGSGYPNALKGDAVSLEAAIVAVADTFDAITHARPYQEVRTVQQALSEINRFSEVLYPGDVVSALNSVSKTLTK